MSSFDVQIQIEEVMEYVPSAEDLAELEAWFDSLPEVYPLPSSEEKVSE
jgi:hypothetical protein